MNAKTDQPLARLVVYGLGDADARTVRELVTWLYETAHFVEHNSKQCTNGRYTARLERRRPRTSKRDR